MGKGSFQQKSKGEEFGKKEAQVFSIHEIVEEHDKSNSSMHQDDHLPQKDSFKNLEMPTISMSKN